VVASNAMITAYAQGGQIYKAEQLFRGLKKRDNVSWNALIRGFTQNDELFHANLVYYRMPRWCATGVRPNAVSFAAILVACTHKGSVDDARHHIVAMQSDHEVEPLREHFCCMVDLLGRAGKLDDAMDLIQTMPFLPNDVEW
ncbi:hypothetical protein SELMODRAFT_70094, partial [Selaginella moellendorffii]